MANTPEAVANQFYDDFLSPFKKDVVTETIAILKHRTWSRDNMVSPDAHRRVVAVMSGDRLVSNADAAKSPYEAAVDRRLVRKARGIADGAGQRSRSFVSGRTVLRAGYAHQDPPAQGTPGNLAQAGPDRIQGHTHLEGAVTLSDRATTCR